MKQILFCLALLLLSCKNPVCEMTNTNQTNGLTVYKVATGCGILALELIGIPAVDFKYNYRTIPKIDNPFKYVCEKEPYIQDELWHFVGASALTEINYRMFSNCFMMQNPYVVSGLLTVALMTGMECCDAWCGSGFSVRDECGNILGTIFSLVKIRYPEFPVKVRIGIKDLSSFNVAVKNALHESVRHQLGKQYDYMKVELIYTIPDLFLYGGVAVSRTDNKKDLFGITAGLDVFDCVNSVKKGWWNESLSFVSRYFSASVSFTYWMK